MCDPFSVTIESVHDHHRVFVAVLPKKIIYNKKLGILQSRDFFYTQGERNSDVREIISSWDENGRNMDWLWTDSIGNWKLESGIDDKEQNRYRKEFEEFYFFERRQALKINRTTEKFKRSSSFQKRK